MCQLGLWVVCYVVEAHFTGVTWKPWLLLSPNPPTLNPFDTPKSRLTRHHHHNERKNNNEQLYNIHMYIDICIYPHIIYIYICLYSACFILAMYLDGCTGVGV